MFKESQAVSKVKSDSKYFFRYANNFSVCANETGPFYGKTENFTDI